MINDKPPFAEKIDVIEEAIRKQRSRWQLDAINWIDFDDVEQIIKAHIYKKWDMWDHSRPLEPWVNTIITHQIYNLIRNHYGNYVKPCVNCEFSVGDNECTLTSNGTQNEQCLLYSKWVHRKKAGLDLKVTLSTENHLHEISSRPSNDFQYEASVDKLNEHMKLELSETHFIAYKMMFFEQASEEEIAGFMGYKTTEKKRKAGYRQVKNLRKMFYNKAKEIIKKHDIIIHAIDE